MMVPESTSTFSSQGRRLRKRNRSVVWFDELESRAMMAAPTIGPLLSTAAPLLTRGAALTLTVNNVQDSDNDQMFVRFYYDSNHNGVLDADADTLINTTGATPTAQTSVDTTQLAVGTATFFAVAIDQLDNTSAVSSRQLTVYRAVPSQSGVAFWDDSQGNTVRAKLKGPGNFTAYFDTSSNADPTFFDVLHTTLASKLSIAPLTKGVTTKIGSLAVGDLDDGPRSDLGALLAPKLELGASLYVEGGMKNLVLGDYRGASFHSIIIGSTQTNSTPKLNIAMGRVSDMFFEADTPIGKLTAIDWEFLGNLQNSLAIKSAGSITITGKRPGSTGDFRARVSIANDPGPKTLGIGSMSVAGSVSGTWDTFNASIGSIKAKSFDSWNAQINGDIGFLTDTKGDYSGDVEARSVGTVSINGDFRGHLSLTQTLDPTKLALKSLKVTGGIIGAEISSTGNLGSITASSIGQDSIIAAGITLNDVTLPTGAVQFTSLATTIKSVTLTGKAAPSTPSIGKAVIAAGFIGSVTLKDVSPSAAQTDYGIAADRIGSFKRVGAVTLLKLDTPGEAFRSGRFVLQLV